MDSSVVTPHVCDTFCLVKAGGDPDLSRQAGPSFLGTTFEPHPAVRHKDYAAVAWPVHPPYCVACGHEMIADKRLADSERHVLSDLDPEVTT